MFLLENENWKAFENSDLKKTSDKENTQLAAEKKPESPNVEKEFLKIILLF